MAHFDCDSAEERGGDSADCLDGVVAVDLCWGGAAVFDTLGREVDGDEGVVEGVCHPN